MDKLFFLNVLSTSCRIHIHSWQDLSFWESCLFPWVCVCSYAKCVSNELHRARGLFPQLTLSKQNAGETFFWVSRTQIDVYFNVSLLSLHFMRACVVSIRLNKIIKEKHRTRVTTELHTVDYLNVKTLKFK